MLVSDFTKSSVKVFLKFAVNSTLTKAPLLPNFLVKLISLSNLSLSESAIDPILESFVKVLLLFKVSDWLLNLFVFKFLLKSVSISILNVLSISISKSILASWLSL